MNHDTKGSKFASMIAIIVPSYSIISIFPASPQTCITIVDVISLDDSYPNKYFRNYKNCFHSSYAPKGLENSRYFVKFIEFFSAIFQLNGGYLL